MYLTKIDLIPQQRGIRQALGDCQQLHQMIMGLFESDRKSSGVQVRTGNLSLFQSACESGTPVAGYAFFWGAGSDALAECHAGGADLEI